MSDVNGQIREQIEAFVSDLNVLVRQAALEAVASVLGGDTPRRRAANGQSRFAGVGQRASFREARGKGAKRSSQEIESTRQNVLDYVRRNPGQGVEQIAKGLDTASRDLVLPIRKLVGEGELSTKGQKRATKYFAGAAGGPARSRRRGRRPAKK